MIPASLCEVHYMIVFGIAIAMVGFLAGYVAGSTDEMSRAMAQDKEVKNDR